MRRAPLAVVMLALALTATLLSRSWQGDLPGDAGSGEEAANRNSALVTPDPTGTPGLEGHEIEGAVPDEPRSTRSLWVLVEDATDGQPIPGARVEAVLEDGSLVRGLTMSNGLVRIEGLPAISTQVTASADGYVTDIPEWPRSWSDHDARVLIQLRHAHKRPIRVLALETGFPVSGARLVMHPCLMVRINRSPFVLDAAIEAGTTDGDGHANLPVRVGSETLRGVVLAIHADGRRTTWRPVDERVPPEAEPWVLRLPPGGAIAGTVRDGDGQPIAGVAISAFPGERGHAELGERTSIWPLCEDSPFSLFSSSGAGYWEDAWVASRRTISGADGRYRIPGIGLGEPYVISARKRGYTPADVAGSRAGRDEDIHWDPILKAEGRLDARVVDAEGNPIPGAYESALGRSDIGEPGGGRATERWTQQVALSGIVIDEDEQGLPGVVVRDRTGAPLAVSDAQGRFSATVDPHIGVTLGAHGPYATVEFHTPPADGSLLRLVARPRRLVPVLIRILRPEEAPAPASLRVTLRSHRSRGAGYIDFLPGGTFDVPWPSPDAREVLIEREMSPGAVLATVNAAGFFEISREIQIERGGGGFRDAWTLDRGQVARGRVFDERGQPIAGARVEVGGPASGGTLVVTGTGYTGADGTYEVGGLSLGPWTYRVTADGHLPQPEPWSFGLERSAQRVDPNRITLVRGGTIRVVVVDAEGFRRTQVGVSLQRQTSGAAGAKQDPDLMDYLVDYAYGTTGLDGAVAFLVAPGTWNVSLPSGLTSPPGLAAPQDTVLRAGETVELLFVLPED